MIPYLNDGFVRCFPDGLSVNYNTFTRVLSSFVPIASKEGSVIESEASEEAEVPEAITQPSKQ